MAFAMPYAMNDGWYGGEVKAMTLVCDRDLAGLKALREGVGLCAISSSKGKGDRNCAKG
jgi:hypothetical protein